MKFSVEFKDDQTAARVIESLCMNYQYQKEIDGEPNPQSPAQFANFVVRRFLIDNVKACDANCAAEAARKAALEQPEIEINDPDQN